MAASSDIVDLLAVHVPVGGRAVVMADLHLGPDPPLTQVAATGELASAIEAATGPGALVIAGNLFDAGVEPSAALADHPRFVAPSPPTRPARAGGSSFSPATVTPSWRGPASAGPRWRPGSARSWRWLSI